MYVVHFKDTYYRTKFIDFSDLPILYSFASAAST